MRGQPRAYNATRDNDRRSFSQKAQIRLLHLPALRCLAVLHSGNRTTQTGGKVASAGEVKHCYLSELRILFCRARRAYASRMRGRRSHDTHAYEYVCYLRNGVHMLEECRCASNQFHFIHMSPYVFMLTPYHVMK
jgi:hypothetical protein